MDSLRRHTCIRVCTKGVPAPIQYGLRWLYSNNGATGSGAWASRVPATQLRFVPQSTAVSLSAIQRSVFRLLILCMTLTCPYTSLTRVSTGATTIYPATNPYNQDPFSTPHDNPSTAYPPRGQEYQSSHPPVGLDPFTDSPRHQITTKHTLRPLIFLTPSLHRRHRHLPFISDRSSSMSVTHLAHLARHIVPPTFTFLPHLR